MLTDACNEECATCPLLPVCGGIEKPNYSCPFFDCPGARADGLDYMEQCTVCKLPKMTWRFTQQELENLVDEIQSLGQTRIDRLKLPKIVPMIDFPSKSSHIWNQIGIEGVIIEFHQLLGRRALDEINARGIRETLGYDGLVLLSSVMPDNLLIKPETFRQFIETARNGEFDAVIGWDVPAYSDMPLYDSWKNLLMGLKLTYGLLELDVPVMPLAKGNNVRQIGFSINTLTRIGFRDIALHASEYLYNWRRDPIARNILYHYSGVLTSRAENILLLGATNMHTLLFAKSVFFEWDKVSVGGLSWYLDAENHRLYTPEGEIGSREVFLECDCKQCNVNGPWGVAKDISARAAHNLQYVHSVAANEREPEMVAYDFIVEKNARTIIAGDLHIGSRESLYTDFLDLLMSERPDTLILLGNEFELQKKSIDFEHIKKFFETMRAIGVTLAKTRGCRDDNPEDLLRNLHRLAAGKTHVSLVFKKPVTIDDSYLLDFYRLHSMAKTELTIKLPNAQIMLVTHGDDIVPERNTDLKDAQLAMKGRRRLKKVDWLVMGHIHRAFLQEESGIASPGAWQLPTPDMEELVAKEDVMRTILVEPSGEVTLI